MRVMRAPEAPKSIPSLAAPPLGAPAGSSLWWASLATFVFGIVFGQARRSGEARLAGHARICRPTRSTLFSNHPSAHQARQTAQRRRTEDARGMQTARARQTARAQPPGRPAAPLQHLLRVHGLRQGAAALIRRRSDREIRNQLSC